MCRRDKVKHSAVMLPRPSNEVYTYRDGTHLDDAIKQGPHVSTRFIHWDAIDSVKADKLPELYTSRAECCGCTGCMTECPTGAICMEFDEEGFKYPVVDAAKCLCCGACTRVCAFGARQSKYNN